MKPLILAPDIAGITALYMVYRERRADLLDLDTRKRLYERVQTYPGLHLSEIARGCQMETNHAKYHLEYLEAHGMLTSRHEANFVRYYPRTEGAAGPRDVVEPREKELLSQLRRPIPLHVTVLLLDRDSATHAELLPLVDIAHGTLHYHLKNMERVGILLGQKEGRERRYHLRERDLLLRLLLRYKPPDELVRGFLKAWEDLAL